MNQNQNQGDRTKPNTQPSHSSEYAPYPKLDPNDVASPAHDWTTSGNSATTMPPESNPYLTPSSDVLGKWGKKASEATKMAEDLAGNMAENVSFGFKKI
ncbi:hypothetical protein CsSME_00051337 [Camellia sinensis var. sinensis]